MYVDGDAILHDMNGFVVDGHFDCLFAPTFIKLLVIVDFYIVHDNPFDFNIVDIKWWKLVLPHKVIIPIILNSTRCTGCPSAPILLKNLFLGIMPELKAIKI